VVGYGFHATTGPDQEPHAFLWQDGVMVDLGTYEGRTESFANGINNRGQIVGLSRDYSGNGRALLWQPEFGVECGRTSTSSRARR
jgi:probable HAF family extracellular repeat protein